MNKKWAERMFSLILMVIAASAFIQTLGLLSQTGVPVGPALFPRLASVALFVFGMVIFIKTFTQHSEDLENMLLPSWRIMGQMLLFLVITMLILLIIPLTGWLLAQFFLVFFFEVIFGKRKWTSSLVIAVSAMFIIYGIFELGLGIRLPRGIFENIL